MINFGTGLGARVESAGFGVVGAGAVCADAAGFAVTVGEPAGFGVARCGESAADDARLGEAAAAPSPLVGIDASGLAVPFAAPLGVGELDFGLEASGARAAVLSCGIGAGLIEGLAANGAGSGGSLAGAAAFASVAGGGAVASR